MNNRISILAIAVILIAGLAVNFSSCKKDDDEKELAVGDAYAGGYIIHLNSTKQGGIVCAKLDQSGGNAIQWAGNVNSNTNATGTAVGTGQANTTAIVNDQGTAIHYAARICNELVLEGYSDWYLPSKDELNLMFSLALSSKGNFQDNIYWSSTEEPTGSSGGESGDAWCQDFDSNYGNYGDQNYDGKNSKHIVRAVRTFVKE